MPTDEELAPPLGFFNYADSYWYAAQQLRNLKLKIPHSGAPIYFLYHSLKLRLVVMMILVCS